MIIHTEQLTMKMKHLKHLLIALTVTALCACNNTKGKSGLPAMGNGKKRSSSRILRKLVYDYQHFN